MAIDNNILKILSEECNSENLSKDTENKLLKILNTWDSGQEIEDQIKDLIESEKLNEG